MKRLMAILVLVVAVPAMAAVTFTASDAGGGKLKIAYTTSDGDLPRGVAFRVACDGGAVVDFAAAVAVDPAFNTFIDWAYSNPLNYAVGNGHPLAKATEAGALAADAADFSVSMGVLDQTGAQKAGPATSANLITIQLKNIPTAGTNVTISGDTLRGPASGVVGSVLTSNLPISVKVMPVVTDPCLAIFQGASYSKQLAKYMEYKNAGYNPSCWCNKYQCDGDGANDKHVLGYRVYTTDLNVMSASWQKKLGDAALNPCADFAHDTHVLGYRVYTTDLNKLSANWKKTDAQLPGNCPRVD
jgi:hypothetical protein